MESRESKFKKYRLDLELKENFNNEENSEVSPEVLDQPSENQDKKTTLAISIDQIIEAHDEYTMIIQQKELEEKIKREKKENRKAKLKKIGKICAILAVLIAITSLLVILIVKILL